jgi:hypothetical protein
LFQPAVRADLKDLVDVAYEAQNLRSREMLGCCISSGAKFVRVLTSPALRFRRMPRHGCWTLGAVFRSGMGPSQSFDLLFVSMVYKPGRTGCGRFKVTVGWR